MLVWARQTAGFADPESAAIAENIDADTLRAWESGDGTPSLAVLRKLAKRYKRPTMVFYLPSPPKQFSVVKDFRLLAKTERRPFSPELRHAIRAAQERQAWAVELLQDQGLDKSELVGSVALDDEPEDVARSLRTRLGVTLAEQGACEYESQAFQLWRRSVENAGVFVFQTSLELSEIRGCSLANDYAPAVLVNSRDTYSARIFTLIHEVAHVLLGESAVSGAGDESFRPTPRRKVERFCNRVAAGTLIPAADFKARVPADWMSHDDEVIRVLSKTYRVSRPVIVLRLFETDLADKRYVDRKLSLVSRKASPPSPGPVPQHTKAIARCGHSFARMAVSAYRGGDINGSALTALIGMKLKHLPTLESNLFRSRATPEYEFSAS